MAVRSERAILSVAAKAAGACTRSELRSAGVPDRTISDRAASGFLCRVGPGLYLVPSLVTADTGSHLAVKANPRGALSHLSAARLWGFPLPPADHDQPVEVTVPRPSGTGVTVPGVVVHESRRWSVDDLAEPRPRLVATGPARTIVDLGATELSDRRLRHIVESQVVANRVTLDRIAECLARTGGRGVVGSGRIRKLVDALDNGQPLAASELERRLSHLLDHRLARQYRPPWYDGVRGIVDLADPGSRTIVEADGRRWHTSSQAMDDDRRRDRVAAANGWAVLRVTWDDVTRRPAATAAEVNEVIGRRSEQAA